ncbi:MAG TPA: hypothetical protein VF637_14230 [Sphingomicrobium sp.]
MRSSLFLLVALASCAPQGMQPGAPDALGQELAGRTPAGTSNCVSQFGSQNVRVVNPTTIAYGHGRTVYINRLTSACPALSPHNTLIIESQGGQYCRGDHVRGLEPGAIIPGPTCFLGDWTAYRR